MQVKAPCTSPPQAGREQLPGELFQMQPRHSSMTECMAPGLQLQTLAFGNDMLAETCCEQIGSRKTHPCSLPACAGWQLASSHARPGHRLWYIPSAVWRRQHRPGCRHCGGGDEAGQCNPCRPQLPQEALSTMAELLSGPQSRLSEEVSTRHLSSSEALPSGTGWRWESHCHCQQLESSVPPVVFLTIGQ